MQIYKSSSANWPLLQSKTEQKFKNGLFNVSAEYIRPRGNSDLPANIPTSYGTADIWPYPTVSIGTDGFEKINATGYGIWNASIIETTTALVPAEVTFGANILNMCPNGSKTVVPLLSKIRVFVENKYISRPGNLTSSQPPLKIFSDGLIDITDSVYNATSIFGIIQSQYNGDFSNKKIPKIDYIQSIKTNNFGNIKLTETVFAVDNLILDFGIFDAICPPTP